ncbi:liprin-beta-1 isoform X2 [Belonocnema kinseyi]|nr:liprin-beta-1 isoform X2 [Belonocnema kinseyi]XP_033216201.1 liprin-beta-1 isoform X2 [Belonocnema kinseyi]XP_033216202.1 liprin-beta-1 isoform X2 [Belonocnema kinseyi]XP_033216203.1 liprin-beta-1 isoform X2 [Belonocnema kinseyi]XP_033216204.1 liprin-beta-1 isoform X2 [Belonocnema kinseyi]XP_033216205.1 liprin-beta-1 isoform X2 [Belonocnema kinseyi]XP_033216206.1 liprin-beta-1 isoform X2 [Belonocnema kinseyi]
MGKNELNDNKPEASESTLLNHSSFEASKMLEAALLQMDDIISGVCADGSEVNSEWKNSVLNAADNLVTAIKKAPSPLPLPDQNVIDVLVKWLQPEHLRKLENERSVLRMEISVLAEQVDAQSNKIHELEHVLQENMSSLRQMEEALQKEVISRSGLETQKLELLTSLSEMKLQLANLEHENFALRTTYPPSHEDQFSRYSGQCRSLPRPSTFSKKAVVFCLNLITMEGSSITAEEQTLMNEISSCKQEKAPRSFAELNVEEIGYWLVQLGLECYAGELRKWNATGQKLLDSTQDQIEKELDIKNPLHRKKLLYAIETERCHGTDFLESDKMDNAAVLRWLDDIGLPQHKEAFQIAKIDGRVLHRLMTEDLLNLGVISQLHAASFRRGIQVLRDLNFQFDSLERRSANGNGADGTNVALWTNHRVMEWLRVVDLAEYAPNMRGSGVHGGLMVYEGRFTPELLATLLSISPSKTLLRRHLTTHFNQILGREVVQHKRVIESSPGFVPLSLTARLKVPKKSQFTLKRKKSKNEADFTNLVCPLESSTSCAPSSPTSAPSRSSPTSSPNSPNLHSVTL